MAIGLCAYLNTEYCDTIFRTFSGHTQVNATDLKNMKYPSQDFLIQLGKLTTDADIEKYDLILKDLINDAQ
jgi:adenine-specific DNA-methyltransferase